MAAAGSRPGSAGWRRLGAAPARAGRSSAPPARAPANQRAEREPGLWCERNVGDQADQNAEHEPDDGAESDRGRAAHVTGPLPLGVRVLVWCLPEHPIEAGWWAIVGTPQP